MNTKRQTVWLVSMLGLMVILSAYYLFTGEADQVPVASEQTNVSEIEVNGVELMDPTLVPPNLNLDEVAALHGSEHSEGTNASDETSAERKVLDQLAANQSGDAAITTLQMTRNADFSRQMEELTSTITNVDATQQQIEEAINKHDALMDLETKLIAFEEKLLGDYGNVVVTYDNEKDHYTVNVYAAELDKSEAVSIVRTALNDLDIAIHQISVKLFR